MAGRRRLCASVGGLWPATKLTVPIIVYTRPGCHLCEQVEGWLLEAGATWQPADITADPVLFERYRHRIPVIEIDGREVLAAPVTRAQVRQALAGEWRGTIK